MIDSDRVVNPDVLAQLGVLSAYPGRNGAVALALNALAVNHGVQGFPPMITRSGGRVGSDVQPGRYRTMDSVSGCYWETLDDAGEINDNNFGSAAPQVIMTVRSSDFAVNVEDCGIWVAI